MKALLLFLSLACCAAVATAQIKNDGFETGRDTAATLPKDWGSRYGHGYSFALDDQVHHRGAKSLRISYTPDSTAPAFAPFSQQVPMEVSSIRKVALTVWIKMEDANDGGLWCQIWNGEGKQIGFRNLGMQGETLSGTSDWKKYSLKLTLSPECKKLLIGGYLSKGGRIWFDDFAIEEIATATTPPSKKVQRYITVFEDIVKKHSIYAPAVNWDSVDAALKLVAAGATTDADAAEVGTYILDQVRKKGDHHSFIMSASRSKQNEAENLDGRQPSARLLNEHTGYVYVPGFMSVNKDVQEAFAAKIQSQIRALDSANTITGWVVDLRENTGGNMYPMIAGLGPLIGNGEAGYFATSADKTPWFYRDGKCGTGKTAVVTVRDPYTLKNGNPKIAVLIGGNTASSGEMITISFIGKPNARLFGQPSTGLTTANGMYKLPDNSTLLLASSYCTDRNGKTYKEKIQPDVLIAESGDVIAAAAKWLGE
jgi:hypothetical protein